MIDWTRLWKWLTRHDSSNGMAVIWRRILVIFPFNPGDPILHSFDVEAKAVKFTFGEIHWWDWRPMAAPPPMRIHIGQTALHLDHFANMAPRPEWASGLVPFSIPYTRLKAGEVDGLFLLDDPSGMIQLPESPAAVLSLALAGARP